MAEHVPPRAIVLDIEGTTTPIEFVRDVLFPHARERLPALLRTRWSEPQVAALVQEAAQVSGVASLDVEESVRVFLAWSDADSKLPPLKALQSIVWKQGYLDGSFRSPMYPDVSPSLHAWRARGIDLYVYSSGAVAAQRLLFQYSKDGDLTACFRDYFDATVGPKIDANSYRAIQVAIGREAHEILFLSDNVAEVAAARNAGWRAVLVERTGSVPGREPPAITSFSELIL